MPFGGVETGGGDFFGGAFVIAGGLDLPIFVEEGFGGFGVFGGGALGVCGYAGGSDECGGDCGGEQEMAS